MTDRQELLHHAARCYRKAGLRHDAGRLYTELEDHRALAEIFAQDGNWNEAGTAYALAGRWQDAAWAHGQAGNHGAAAEAWLRAGERLRAAWLFAHEAGRTQRARAILDEFEPEQPLARLAIEIVLARCEPKPGPAARRLRVALSLLYANGVTPAAHDLAQRARTVANHIGRLDLVLLFHAAAWRAGNPAEPEAWQTTARERLGSAEGIPTSPYQIGGQHG